MSCCCMGFRHTAVKRLTSYQTGRIQVFDVDGVISRPRDVTRGLLRCAIVGLFCSCCMRWCCYLVMSYSCVCEWFTDNKLSIHLCKTESIQFASKKKLSKTNILRVSYSGAEIVSQTSFSYLEIILEQSVSCESTAAKILSKHASKPKLQYRRMRLFNSSVKKTPDASEFVSQKLARLGICNQFWQTFFYCTFSSWFWELNIGTNCRWCKIRV